MVIPDATKFNGLAIEGGYILGCRIGQGRVSDVFLATHPGLPHPKVIKLFLSGAHETADAMRREAGAAQVLRNKPGICVAEAAFLLNTPEGRIPALVFPYLGGPVLGSWLAGTRSLQSRLELLRGALESLACVHDAGISHNDLGFGNILVRPEGPSLIDFGRCGFARMGPPPATCKPTAFYDAASSGKNADLRAFAILVHLILTREHPYTGDLATLLSGNWAIKSPFEHIPRPLSRSGDLNEIMRQQINALLHPVLTGTQDRTARELLALWPSY